MLNLGYGLIGLVGGFLADSQFHVGKEAATEDQIIIYDRKSGNLFYDGDGSGDLQQQVNFAKVGKGLDMSAANFYGELFGHA